MYRFKIHNHILLKWEGAGWEGIEPIQKMFTPTQDFSAGSLAWNIESRFVEIKNHGNGGKRQEKASKMVRYWSTSVTHYTHCPQAKWLAVLERKRNRINNFSPFPCLQHQGREQVITCHMLQGDLNLERLNKGCKCVHIFLGYRMPHLGSYYGDVIQKRKQGDAQVSLVALVMRVHAGSNCKCAVDQWICPDDASPRWHSAHGNTGGNKENVFATVSEKKTPNFAS